MYGSTLEREMYRSGQVPDHGKVNEPSKEGGDDEFPRFSNWVGSNLILLFLALLFIPLPWLYSKYANERIESLKKQYTKCTSPKDKLEAWAKLVCEARKKAEKLEVLNVGGTGYMFDDFENVSFLSCWWNSFAQDVLFYTFALAQNEKRFGMGEVIASLVMDAKCNTNNDEKVDEKELLAKKDFMKEIIQAIGDFNLNVTVVSSLLLTVQLPLIWGEVTPYQPLLETTVLKFIFGQDSVLLVWVEKLYDEEDMFVVILQLVATCFILGSLVYNFSVTLQTTKGFGHLMFMCGGDLETQVWHSRSRTIQKNQVNINKLGSDFLRSLFFYILLTRGIIIAIIFMCFVYRLEYLYFVYDVGGNLSIMTHLAKRVDDGSMFKDTTETSASTPNSTTA